MNNIAASLAAHPDNHVIVLYQIGVNEFGSISQAQWKTNVEFVLQSMHNRWPAAVMYLSYPWKCAPDAQLNCTADATADLFAGTVNEIIADLSDYVHAGDDERAWFKGHCAEYSDDVGNLYCLHFYRPAGQARKVQEMLTVLGH